MENTWGIDKNINSGYPYLLWEYPDVEELAPYTVNAVSITDAQGNALTEVPAESFYLEIDVTKNTNLKDADYLIIAVYDENGAFADIKYMKGAYYQNQNIVFGTMIDGDNENIGCIKAFVWNDVSGMTPLSNVVALAE